MTYIESLDRLNMAQDRTLSVKRVRVVVAIMFALVLTAICLPGIAHVQARPSEHETIWWVGVRSKTFLGRFAAVAVPLACILSGIRWRLRYVEIIGWILWVIPLVIYCI